MWKHQLMDRREVAGLATVVTMPPLPPQKGGEKVTDFAKGPSSPLDV
jgi:hypothetical protein